MQTSHTTASVCFTAVRSSSSFLSEDWACGPPPEDDTVILGVFLSCSSSRSPVLFRSLWVCSSKPSSLNLSSQQHPQHPAQHPALRPEQQHPFSPSRAVITRATDQDLMVSINIFRSRYESCLRHPLPLRRGTEWVKWVRRTWISPSREFGANSQACSVFVRSATLMQHWVIRTANATEARNAFSYEVCHVDSEKRSSGMEKRASRASWPQEARPK